MAPTQYQFVCKFTGKPTQKGIKLEQKEGKRKMRRKKKREEKREAIRAKRRKDKTEIEKRKDEKRVTPVEKVEGILKEKAMLLPYKRNDITPQKQCHCSVISS